MKPRGWLVRRSEWKFSTSNSVSFLTKRGGCEGKERGRRRERRLYVNEQKDQTQTHPFLITFLITLEFRVLLTERAGAKAILAASSGVRVKSNRKGS